jgi:hypothetical protein
VNEKQLKKGMHFERKGLPLHILSEGDSTGGQLRKRFLGVSQCWLLRASRPYRRACRRASPLDGRR